MDNADREKIEKIISDRKAAHAFYEDNSQTYVTFARMANDAFAAGELGRKTPEGHQLLSRKE